MLFCNYNFNRNTDLHLAENSPDSAGIRITEGSLYFLARS